MSPVNLILALDQQNHAANSQKGPCKRAVGNMMFSVFGGVNRSDIQDGVARLESKRSPDYDSDSHYD